MEPMDTFKETAVYQIMGLIGPNPRAKITDKQRDKRNKRNKIAKMSRKRNRH